MAFDKMKQLYDMQKKARNVQKELKSMEIEAVSADDAIKVAFNGELKLQSISIDQGYYDNHNAKELAGELESTVTDALNRAQQVAADKTRDIMKEMNINIPGL